jgi:hypothetical protein
MALAPQRSMKMLEVHFLTNLHLTRPNITATLGRRLPQDDPVAILPQNTNLNKEIPAKGDCYE